MRPMQDPVEPSPSLALRPWWQRAFWLLAGALALAAGLVGVFLPLLPTTPLVILSAFCFSRGCLRCERWLLTHPRLGPMVRDWRQHRVIPRRARQFAYPMMLLGSVWGWYAMPPPIRWIPALTCAVVAVWMSRQPSAVPNPVDDAAAR